VGKLIKRYIILLVFLLFANIAKANDTMDEYITDNYMDMPPHIQNQIDDLLTYGDRYKKTIFAIIHNYKVYEGNPSCHDWEEESV